MKQLRSTADYGYRTNDDGSIDLICLYCGSTVLKTSAQNELRKAESEHSCEAKTAKAKSAANWIPVALGTSCDSTGAALQQFPVRTRFWVPPYFANLCFQYFTEIFAAKY